MVLIVIWVLLFIMIKILGCEELVVCKGIRVIDREYYRFFSGLLFHQNAIHLLANCFGMYWVSTFLKNYISLKEIILIAILGGIVTNICFSVIYPNSTSFGGSPMVYALIGAIVVLIFSKRCDFKLGTWYGNSIFAYAILANIPLFSKDISTLVIHSIALGVGAIIMMVLPI